MSNHSAHRISFLYAFTYPILAPLNSCKLLERVEPYHPTAAFNMTVGTSTGGIIAMGLLAGNSKNGKRVPMTVEEIIGCYQR